MEKLEQIKAEALKQIETSGALDKLNDVRVNFLGKKGELTAIMKSMKAKLTGGIIHCFSGSAEIAKEYLKLGYYISFAGPLTFKKAPKLQEACRIVPADRLLIETDSPYMAPEPVRGRRNEPANVRYVGIKLAELRGETPEAVAEYTTKNAMKVYGLDQ